MLGKMLIHGLVAAAAIASAAAVFALAKDNGTLIPPAVADAKPRSEAQNPASAVRDDGYVRGRAALADLWSDRRHHHGHDDHFDDDDHD